MKGFEGMWTGWLVPFHATGSASAIRRSGGLGLFRGKERLVGIALAAAVACALALGGLALARDVAPEQAVLNVNSPINDLDPESAGLYRVTNKWAFLYLTGSLPGTLSSAEWQWRSGFGAANYWWLDASESDLYLFPKNEWARNWNPDEPVGPYNYLGMVVSLSDFQEWFWCGIPIYDRYHRFLGYGCHPEYGPRPENEGKLAPWMVAAIEQSRPNIWTVLGAMCILKRSEHLEVQPPCPDSEDAIRLRISGQYGSSCPSVQYNVLSSGPSIEIEGSISSGGDFCAMVVTTWSVDVDLGVLASGTYTVTTNFVDQESGSWGFDDTLTFDVSEAGIE